MKSGTVRLNQGMGRLRLIATSLSRLSFIPDEGKWVWAMFEGDIARATRCEECGTIVFAGAGGRQRAAEDEIARSDTQLGYIIFAVFVLLIFAIVYLLDK